MMMRIIQGTADHIFYKSMRNVQRKIIYERLNGWYAQDHHWTPCWKEILDSLLQRVYIRKWTRANFEAYTEILFLFFFLFCLEVRLHLNIWWKQDHSMQIRAGMIIRSCCLLFHVHVRSSTYHMSLSKLLIKAILVFQWASVTGGV